jgi:type I restriction enzyme R subunit
VLTEEQRDIMRHIAEYVIDAGAISAGELNEIDTDLWRKAVISFDAQKLREEMITLSKFLLNYKVA